MNARSEKPLLALTIDVEWAPLPIVEEMIGNLTERQIPATLFCTEKPPLPTSSLHEMALHPNFEGMADWKPMLAKMQAAYPSATGLRSHCLHSDTRLVRLLPAQGFRYQSNLFVPGQPVAPYRRESGLWEIPIHYMDFFHLCALSRYPSGFSTASIPCRQPLVVVDFHPIPWFINAADLSDYENAKPVYQDPAALRKLRRKGSGVFTLLEALLKEVADGGWKAVTLSEVVRNLEQSEASLWQWPGSTPASAV